MNGLYCMLEIFRDSACLQWHLLLYTHICWLLVRFLLGACTLVFQITWPSCARDVIDKVHSIEMIWDLISPDPYFLG